MMPSETLDPTEMNLGDAEILYSLEEEEEGFSIVPFDRWGHAVRVHPLRGALFASPEEAFAAIRAVSPTRS